MVEITFISTFAYAFFCPGSVNQAGGQARIYNLIKKLATYPEYRINCIVGDFNQPDVMSIDGVKLIKAPVNKASGAIQVLKTLSDLNSDLYVDFIASPRLALLFLLKKLKKSKYIFFTASDADVTTKYREVENGVYYRTYLLGLKHADRVVCQTPKQVQLLRRNHRLNAELILSPYFEIEAKPDHHRKHTVLWIGRSAWYKRPAYFLKLAELFPGYRFVMICNRSDYDDGFSELLRQKRGQLKNLACIEYVRPDSVSSYYQQAKVLVNTSDFEGFPNTFIEAAIHGTPILSLNTDPNCMLSVHGAGIFCHGDFRTLAASLRMLMTSENGCRSMGRRAYEYALRHHQLSDAVEKARHLIDAVTNH